MADYFQNIWSLIGLIIGCIVILTCTIMDIVAYSKFHFSSNTLENFSKNFKDFPIMDIKDSLGNCQSDYELFLNDDWPGYVSGCDCRNTWNIDITRKIHRGSCSFNETWANCKDLPYQKPVEFTYYRQKVLCKKRTNENYLSYIASKKISRDSYCGLGMKLCGKLDSTDNFLCVSESDVCPINKILIINYNDNVPADKNYTSINLGNGKILYFSNKNATKDDIIFTSFKLSEDLPCINSHELNTKSKGSKYILDSNFDYYGCSQFLNNKYYDDRYRVVDNLNYYDLIRDNRIDMLISRYPDVPASSLNYNVELYVRPYYGWKYSCIRDRQYGVNFAEDFNLSLSSLSGRLLALMIISIICFLLYIMLISFFLTKEKGIALIFLIIVSVLEFILMIIAFTTFSSSNGMYSENSELLNLNCGDEYMNMFLKYLYDYLAYLPNLLIWNAILLLCSLLLKAIPFLNCISCNNSPSLLSKE